MAESREFEGKSVEEAIAAGLAALGVAEEEVDVEIVSRGSRGIFGIGSEDAVVRISQRSDEVEPADAPAENDAADEEADDAETAAPEESASPEASAGEEESEESPVFAEAEEDVAADDVNEDVDEDASDEELADLATDLLSQVVELMGFDAEIEAGWRQDEPDDREPVLHLNIEGENLSALIGPRGETVDSMQYLLRLMVNQRLHRWQNIVVDVDHYKQKRVDRLQALALRMADQVSDSGRSMSLEPMPSHERRIIHLALRDHAEVYTESSGEGDRRQVYIMVRE